MRQKVCYGCGRELYPYDRFCDKCGARQPKLELDDAETVAAKFLESTLRARSVDVLETKPDGESGKITVSGLLADGDERRRRFEVKIDSLTKKVVAWNMRFSD